MAGDTGLLSRGILYRHGPPETAATGPEPDTRGLWSDLRHHPRGGGKGPGIVVVSTVHFPLLGSCFYTHQ